MARADDPADEEWETVAMDRQGKRGEGAPSAPRVAAVVVALGFMAVAVGGVAAAAPPAPPPPPKTVGGTSCTNPTIKACVDLSDNRAWLLDGQGKVVHGPVANTHGGKGQETPVGEFRVQWKNKDHRSSEFGNRPMPNAVFFDTHGRAFHEGSLERDSAGCVRLSMPDSERFFAHLHPGDGVQIVP